MRQPTLVFVFLLVSAASAAQDCGWRWVNPAPPRADFYRATRAHGLFVAVGAAGTVVTSVDGHAWTPVESGTTADLYGIEWAAGVWVAVGDGVVLSSSDARNWLPTHNDPTASFQDVEFGASHFVVVGSGQAGRTLTSSDGENWQQVTPPFDGESNSIVWADGLLYAAVDSDVYVSEDDGVQWRYTGTVPHDPFDNGLGFFQRVDLAWTGSNLLWAGGSEAYRSGDGEEWELMTAVDGCSEFSRFVGAFADEGVSILSAFGVCPSSSLDVEALIYVSADDGSSWTIPWRELGGALPGVARLGATFVAIGAAGDLVVGSGIHDWSCPGAGCTAAACADGFADVLPRGNRVIAAGGVGSCQHGKRLGGATFASSADGEEWDASAESIDPILGLAWDGVQYVAVGRAFSATSSNGSNWQEHDVPTVHCVTGAAFGNGLFVAVGDDGLAMKSVDGATWSGEYTGTEEHLRSVIWDGDDFVAVGGAGTVLKGGGPRVWRSGSSIATSDLYGVTLGGGQYIAVGDHGTVLASGDGEVWLRRIAGTDAQLRGVAWNGEYYAAVGFEEVDDSRPAVVLASADGYHWTEFSVPGQGLQRVAPWDGGFVAAGSARSLLHADCLETLVSADPQYLVLRQNEARPLVLSLSQATDHPVDLQLSSSAPAVVAVPATTTVAGGSAEIEVELGIGLPGTANISIALPASLGGGRTMAIVVVEPPIGTPRRAGGRRLP